MLDQRHKSFLTYLGSHPLKHFLSHIIHVFLSFTFSPSFYTSLFNTYIFLTFLCLSLFYFSFLLLHHVFIFRTILHFYFIHFFSLYSFYFFFQSFWTATSLSKSPAFICNQFLSFLNSLLLRLIYSRLFWSISRLSSITHFSLAIWFPSAILFYSAFHPFSKKYTFSPSLSRLPIFDLSLLYLFHHSLPPSTAKHAVTHSLVTFTNVSLTSLWKSMLRKSSKI